MIKKEKPSKDVTVIEKKVPKEEPLTDEEILELFEGTEQCIHCRMDDAEENIEMLWSDLWATEDDVDDISCTQFELLNGLDDIVTILDELVRRDKSTRMNLCMLYVISIIAFLLGAVSLYFILF